jgi:hypothetical protein
VIEEIAYLTRGERLRLARVYDRRAKQIRRVVAALDSDGAFATALKRKVRPN